MRNALWFVAVLAAFVVGFEVNETAGSSSAPTTPLHQTAVFFDGVTNGDFRQTCRVWLAGRTHQKQCVAYLATLTATAGLGDYRVLPHSYKGWREGQTKVASVRVYNAAGSTVLTARLVKTRKHGWLVTSVSS